MFLPVNQADMLVDKLGQQPLLYVWSLNGSVDSTGRETGINPPPPPPPVFIFFLNSFWKWLGIQNQMWKNSDPTMFCLCWGLTSQSTIFQSCRDGAIASWVINQYFRGVKCLAQGHNTAAVGLEPPTSRSGVRHSTTEPPRSPYPTMYYKELRALSLNFGPLLRL